MKAYQQNIEKLEAADTQVLGVTADSPFANKAFAEKVGAQFPLLAWAQDTMKAYGVDKEYDVHGIKVTSARRTTFLIGKDGKVLEIQQDRQAVDPTDIVTSCQRRKLKE
jgi:peroxiredoxin